MKLSCIASGSLPVEINWKKNGGIILNKDPRIQIIRENEVHLHIMKAKEADEGVYECEATNKISTHRKSIELSYLEKPTITMVTPLALALINIEYTIHCYATGKPKPIITWTKDKITVTSRNSEQVYSNGTLIIQKLRLNHSGLYECTAENELGKAVAKKNVEVGSVPQFDKETDDINIDILKNGTIFCGVKGHPTPSVIWSRKDGKILSKRFANMFSCSLILTEAHPEDEGVYVATATNKFGKQEKCINIHISGIVKPVLAKGNSVEISTVGKHKELTCLVTKGNPPPTVVWYKDGEILKMEDLVLLDGRIMVNRSLIFQYIRPGHKGTYECTVENFGGETRRRINLDIQDVPGIIGESLIVKKMKQGNPVILPCEVHGKPKPKVTWMKDKKPLRIIPPYAFHDTSDSLFITAAILKTNGTYECIANNSAGQSTKVIQLFVLYRPRIFPMKDKISKRGEVVTSFCEVESFPVATIKWYKDGLHFDNEYITYSENNSSLRFVMDLSSSGSYTCNAFNDQGEDNMTTKITVAAAPQISTFLPKKKVLRIYTNFSILCQATGTPSPIIYWLKNGIPFSNKGLLIINNVTHNDAALYTCVANNYEGSDEINIKITVKEPPKMGDYAVIRDVIKGDELNISCPVVSGNPPPHVKWLKDDAIIHPTHKIFPNKGHYLLTLRSVQEHDVGNYTCIASNSAGQEKASVSVQVMRPPEFLEDKVITSINKFHGEMIELGCSNIGKPIPKVSWYKNDRPLMKILIPHAMWNVNDQIIYIPKSRRSDKGTYKCTVDNKAGQISRIFHVNILERLSMKSENKQPGHWLQWSAWSRCSATCGRSLKVRTRLCENDNRCEGESHEWEKCYTKACKVDGAWGEWSEWSVCSKSCGAGTRFRRRLCDNPIPQYNGMKCSGQSHESQICNTHPCPVNGFWSEWSKWEPCKPPCSNSSTRRTRKCTNPIPAFGGKRCLGPKEEIRPCSTEDCSVDGGWSKWSPWSACSATCGLSFASKERKCNNPLPSLNGAPCKGKSRRNKKCEMKLCDDIPLKATLIISGSLNEHVIHGITANVNITDMLEERRVTASAKNVFKISALSGWYPYLSFVVSPVLWLTAFQKDKAINGFTLTKGIFEMQTFGHFKSGENVVITHEGQGVDNGKLKLLANIQGTVPLFAFLDSSVKMESYEENYIQTGPGKLYARSETTIQIGREDITCSWKKIVTYNTNLVKTRHVVQTLGVKTTRSSQIKHNGAGSIKPFLGTACPEGFVLSDLGYCEDIDECSSKTLNNCDPTQICTNHEGFYECSCRPGFTKVKNGKCKDVNECNASPHVCSHKCVNMEGTFKCLCPPGFDILSSKTKCSRTYGMQCLPNQMEIDGFCEDQDPCSHGTLKCKNDEICVSIRRLMNCVPIPCPASYERVNNSKSCIKYCNTNKCDSGAIVSESVIPVIFTARHPFTVYEELVQLPLNIEENHLGHTFYRILKNYDGKPFRVTTQDNMGILYSTKPLEADREYSIIVQASTYEDTHSSILYYNKFIIKMYLIGE